MLVKPILDGRTRVVYGSRFLAGRPDAPWLSIAANQVLTGVTNVLFGGRLTDMETCYKVMAADIAKSLNLESNRFDIEPEITAKLLRAGHSILELPIRFEPRSRAQGKKIGWRDGVRAIQVLLKYRFTKMTRLRQGYGAAGLAIAALAAICTCGLRRRARHLGGRRLRFVVLRVDGAGDGRRPPAADERARRRGAVARCGADAGAGRLHPVTGSTRCRVADLRARILGADGAAGRGLRAGCHLLADSDLRARCWCLSAFVIARRLAGGMAGATAAILTATSPIVLFQVVQPMNDVLAAALWLAALALLIDQDSRRSPLVAAGILIGLAILVRPNLAPLALVVRRGAAGARASATGPRDRR